jgi:hypothetical protein
MKTKIMIGLFAIGLFVFNFSFKTNKLMKRNVTLENIKLMQVNATEGKCDNRDQNECTFTYYPNSGGVLNAYGKGWFVMY